MLTVWLKSDFEGLHTSMGFRTHYLWITNRTFHIHETLVLRHQGLLISCEF